MPGIRRHGNGIHGAVLCADRTAGAVVADTVFDERGAFAGRAMALQVRLVLVAEIAQSGQHRVRGGLAEAAEAALGHLGRQPLQFLKVLAAGFAGAKAVEQFEHPLGANAAKRAFAHLLINNIKYCDDKKENIIDDYCALMAATELWI